jgi:hypothetical protein
LRASFLTIGGPCAADVFTSLLVAAMTAPKTHMFMLGLSSNRDKSHGFFLALLKKQAK